MRGLVVAADADAISVSVKAEPAGARLLFGAGPTGVAFVTAEGDGAWPVNTSAATLTPYAARLLVALFHGDYRCLGYDPPAGYALPAADAARRRFDDDLMMRRPAAPAARAGGYCAPCAVEPDDGRRRPRHAPPHGRRRGRQVGPM